MTAAVEAAKAGYAVTWALDGEEALQRVADHPCDLMILDLMLPRRSGFEVLEELARRRRAFPVLILSAKDEEMDKVRALRLVNDSLLEATVKVTHKGRDRVRVFDAMVELPDGTWAVLQDALGIQR